MNTKHISTVTLVFIKQPVCLSTALIHSLHSYCLTSVKCLSVSLAITPPHIPIKSLSTNTLTPPPLPTPPTRLQVLRKQPNA